MLGQWRDGLVSLYVVKLEHNGEFMSFRPQVSLPKLLLYGF
jgi:hypothetical protein